MLTPDLIRQVAFLARLRLEGQMPVQLAAQLDEVIQYVRQLQAVATDQVEPTSHVLPLSNVLREDEPRPSLSQDTVTSMAPARCVPYVAVPKVIDQ